MKTIIIKIAGKLSAFLLSVLFVFNFAGCGGGGIGNLKSDGNSKLSASTVNINWASSSSSGFSASAIPSTVTRIVLNVTASGMASISVSVSTSTGSVTVTVPDGTARTFEVLGYDSTTSTPVYRGVTTADVSGATSITVTTSSASFSASSWSGTKQFGAKTANGSGADTFAKGVATDSNDSLFIVGYTNGGLDGNTLTGTTDFFVTKYDSAGFKQWTKQLGVAGAITHGMSIATDSSGNIFIAGHTDGGLDGNTLTGAQDAFITKYNSAGTKQWTKQLGVIQSSAEGASIATDSSGNIFVAGWTTGNLDGNTLTGTKDAFVTKYDSAGTKQWTKQLGASGKITTGEGVSIDTNGDVYIAGYTDGGISTATITNTLTGTKDYFVAKYANSDGAIQWVKQGGVAGYDTVGVSVAADGGPSVLGYTLGPLAGVNTLVGTQDIFVVDYNADGTVSWTKQYGGTGQTTTGSAATGEGGGTGGYGVGNVTGGTITGTRDAVIAKVDTNGVELWKKFLGVSGADTFGDGVTSDSNGNVFMVGDTAGGLDGNTLIGTTDSFITKYSSAGVHQ